MKDEWTVVDEFDKRLGAIMDQYKKAFEAAAAAEDEATTDLYTWFNEHYDGEHNTPWPKEE